MPLDLYIEPQELYLYEKNEFVYTKEQHLQLEHSLISVSKWEGFYKKSFFLKEDKTKEETMFYIKCMTINKVDSVVYSLLEEDHFKQIKDYINDPMTATTINDKKRKRGNQGQILTSELIYYYMIYNNIPKEFEKWHLNRLLTLISICAIEGSPKDKMTMDSIFRQNSSLNAARRMANKSKG